MNLTIGELHELLGGELRLGRMPPRNGAHTQIGSVVVDSDAVQAGDLYWDVASNSADRSLSAEEAYLRGAIGVVTSGRAVTPWPGRWSLEVADAQTSLVQLASYNRGRCSAKVVAVAGSVGKTTTCAIVEALLSEQFSTPQSESTRRCSRNLAAQMLALDSYHELAIVEYPARQEHCTSLPWIAPDIFVITQWDDGLAAAQTGRCNLNPLLELIDQLPTSTCLVLNGDDTSLRRVGMRTNRDIRWFGRSIDCDLKASQISSEQGMLQFTIAGNRLSVPLWGRHHISSVLAAIAVGQLHGLEWNEITAGLRKFQPASAPCRVVSENGFTLVADDGNLSPLSMRATLALMAELENPGRRIVVCGDLDTQNDDVAQLYQTVGEEAVTQCAADIVIACGSHAEQVLAAARQAGLSCQCAIHCRPTDELVELVEQLVRPGDAVLLKAGRATALPSLLQAFQSKRSRVAA
ncbi:MAG: Mur ligase family protein [Planctomycetota bacterium]|nr:Mur ligase family protein [Planctomycetota bacterium]